MRPNYRIVITALLLATTLASIVPTDNSTTGNYTYADIQLNFSSLDTTAEGEIKQCLNVLKDSLIILYPFELSSGFQRIYSDGWK
jgi:hypothetical protein